MSLTPSLSYTLYGSYLYYNGSDLSQEALIIFAIDSWVKIRSSNPHKRSYIVFHSRGQLVPPVPLLLEGSGNDLDRNHTAASQPCVTV